MDSNIPRFLGTPVRRLGLSKRGGFKSPLTSKASLPNEGSTPLKRSQNSPDHKTDVNPSKIKKSSSNGTEGSFSVEKENSKLNNSEDSGNNGLSSKKDLFGGVSDNEIELINLINVWKTGFKESLFALQLWLKTHEDIHLSNFELTKQLGIQEVVQDHFQNDSEILDYDVDTGG